MDEGGRVRIGSALAALALHVLAFAAAIAIGSSGAAPGKSKTDHLTVIALEPPRPSQPAVRPRSVAAPTQSEPSPMPKTVLQVPPPGLVTRGPAAAVAEAKALPPPAAEAAAPPPPPRSAPPSPTALGGYTRTLWQHIAAHRPRGIRMSGTTVVRFRLSPQGTLISAEVAASSGNLNLDKIALRTVRQAIPMPPPPDGATGDQLIFTVAVEFN